MKILIQTISFTLVLIFNVLQISQLKADCPESDRIDSIKCEKLNKDFCSDEKENILVGCSLSLDSDNVLCSNDMTGSLAVEMTTALAGEHIFSWTYSMNASAPLLPLPAGISNSIMNLSMIPISTPTEVANYTNLPAGYYFLTITGPVLSGQQIFCEASATIVATDFEDPIIICPEPMVVSASPGSCEAVVNTSNLAVFSDPCGVSSEADLGEVTLSAGQQNIIAIIYTASDSNGNTTTASCDISITVMDLENPTITCPPDITVDADNGECGAIVSWDIVANDNCGIASLTTTCILPNGSLSPCVSGGEYPLGNTIVVGTTSDASGNSISCSFLITVTDNENPTIICPQDISVNAATGECGAAVTWAISADDNCSIETVAATCLLPGSDTPEPCTSGMEYPIGTTVVEGTASDVFDNAANCAFLIIVQSTEGNACNARVLPGDCNTDGIVNTDDALYWGLAEGFNGTPRSNATTDCTPQVAPDWSLFVNNVNSKHQDGDGDGTIDGDDLQVLISNFGCVSDYTAPNYASAAPNYRVQPQGINANGKYQYDLYVENGSGAAAIAHGLAFTVSSNVIPISAIAMSTTGSSLHPDEAFAIPDGNRCHVALTRTDNFDVTCGGPIATFLVETSDIPVGIPFDIDIAFGSKIRADATLDNVTGATAFGMYNGFAPNSSNIFLDAAVTHEQCNGLGKALIIPSGGTPPYAYVWNNGANTAQVNDLTSGTYTVVVIDSNGLNQSLTLRINGQTPIYDVNGNLLCGNLCPEYLAPSGITGNGLYSANNALNSDAIIPVGNTAQYKAGQIIELKPGFKVQPDAGFSAEIEDCQ